jgi:hypothetical protein
MMQHSEKEVVEEVGTCSMCMMQHNEKEVVEEIGFLAKVFRRWALIEGKEIQNMLQ